MGCCLSNEYMESTLKSFQPGDVKEFSFEGLSTKAKIISVYDGDTFRAIFYYRGEYIQMSCRALGYDSPELKVSRENVDRTGLKELAFNARNRFSEILHQAELVRLVFSKNDMYGRPLVDIYVNGKHVNSMMIEEGHGKVYNGGSKTPWTIK